MDIQYRSITEDDIRVLASFLLNNNMINQDDEEKLFFFNKKNPHLAKIALEGDNIIGAVLCSCDGFTAHILKLVVKEEFRKQGIGKKLINEVLEELKKIGCPEVSINCKPFLQGWYESQGFVKEDSVVYSKKLGSECDQTC